MKTRRKALGGFFYFRLGYATYLAMVIGIINILTTSYFLAIQNVPTILDVFPSFESYVVFVIIIGFPIVTFIGWLHFKRVGTFSAEAAVYAQAMPYNYKLDPGYQKEVYGPAYLAILRLNIKRATGEKLTEEEIKNIKHLEKELSKLIDGGYVGKPPKGVL